MYTVTYHNTLAGAQNGNDLAMATISTSSDLTVFVRMEDGSGCYGTAELLLDVVSGLVANSASLEACDEGGGQATFNLTNLVPTILNGQSGSVNFYSDAGLSNQIANTNAYVSGTADVYAVVTDGTCSSSPEAIPLTVITFDINDAFLTVNPTSLCGPGNVTVTLNTPSSPAGAYTFNVSYGPTGGPYTTLDLVGMDGAMPLTIAVSEEHEFILNTVTSPGTTPCTQTGAQAPVVIPFGSAPTATATSLEVCDAGGGQGNFDLTQLDNTVNGGSGLPVLWYEDMATTMPIPAPGSYTSSPTSVYAVVDGGSGCLSTPVEVPLTIESAPTASLSLNPNTGCGPTDVTLTFTLPAGENFTIDLTTIDGMGSSTATFNNVANGSTLDFNISENTTYQITGISSVLGCMYTPNPVPEASAMINTPPSANTAALTACGPSGTATFDLTSANNTVNGGTGLTVEWYEDMALSMPIATPGAYSSSGGSVYAVVSDSGCDSAPAEVTLTVDPGPSTSMASMSLCDEGGGQATFDLTSQDATVNVGSGLTVLWFEDMAVTQPIGDPANYQSNTASVYAVVDDGMCQSLPVEVQLTVLPSPSASPTSLELCDEGGGQATFDLSSVDNIVNNGSGNTVTWYTDAGASMAVGTPAAHVSGSGSVFAVVSDGTCESSVVTVTLNVLSLPATSTASLDRCDEGGNQATFDLTSVNSTVDNGAGLTVEWFTDMAATSPIAGPGSFMSGPTTVYAVVSDADCSSEPVAVTLTVSTGVSASPASITLCEESAGQATFDLTSVNNTVNNGTGNNVSWFVNSNGTGSIADPGNFTSGSTSVYAVADDGNCISEPIEVTLTVNPTPEANSTDLTGCDDGSTQATFDLTSVDDEVNGSSGLPVLWTFDDQGMDPIPSPTNFTTNLGFVFATVQGADCNSETVQVFLNIEQGPDLQLSIATAISCSGADDGALNLMVTGTPTFDFDWSDNSLDGQQNPTNLGPGFYSVTVTDGNQCTAEADINLTEPDAITLSCAEFSPVSTTNGSDGVATITIMGGTPSYDLEYTGPTNGFQPAFTEGTVNITNLSAGNYMLTLTDNNNCTETCTFAITDPDCNLTASLSPTQISCFGAEDGQIVVNLMGGTPDFTYDWSDDTYDGQSTLTNLPPGTYNLTVTDDQGCEALANTTITQPAELTAVCSVVNNVSMTGGADGEAEVAFAGGTAPYDIEWFGPQDGNTTSATAGTAVMDNLMPGMYTAQVTDANNCVVECSFTITEPTCNISVTLTPSPAACNGEASGSIDVEVSGGSPDFTYTWDPAIHNGQSELMNISAGMYSLTVTDALGCEAMATTEVTEPEAIALLCMAGDNPSSVGGSDGTATIEISGGTADYTIDYFGGGANSGTVPGTAGINTLTGLGASNYTITVNDANMCSTTCNFTLTDPTCDLELELTGTDPSCAGDSNGSLELTITGSAAIVSIDWNDDDLDGTEDPSNLTAGTYEVTVTDALNCVETASFTLDVPNPLVIDCSNVILPSSPAGTDGGLDLVIGGGNPDYDISWDGPVSGAATVNSTGTLPITGLTPGNYMVTVVDGNGCEASCEFLITNPNCNLDMTTNFTNVSCEGGDDGSISLFISDPSPPFVFDWNQDQYDSEGPIGHLTDIPAGFYSVTVTDSGNCIDTASFTILDGVPVEILCEATMQPSAPGASDGIITVELISGPGGPYTLNYDNGAGTSGSMAATVGDNVISGLPSGTYSITVSDPELCQASCELSLSAGCEISETHTDLLCGGDTNGSINITALGGNGVFTFDWSDDSLDGQSNPTNLGAGEYSVTVSDGDLCVDSLMITISGPAELSLTCAEDTPASGPANQDGIATITINGGTAPFDLTITGPVPGMINTNMNGAQTVTDLLPGDYMVTVEDANGCTADCQFTITDSSCTFDLTVAGTDESCGGTNDGSAEATPTGGTTPYTYAWSNGGDMAINNNLAPGMYTVTVTDNAGCVAVGSVTINPGPAPPELTIGAGGTICPGECFELPLSLTGTPPFTLNYELDYNGTITPFSYEITSLNDILTICPDDLGIPPGDFVLNSIELLSNPCTLALNEQRSFTYEAPATGIFSTTLCTGDSLVFGGVTFNESNLSQTVTLPDAAANGCDSLVDVTIDFFPAADLLFETTICPGDTLTFAGQQFYQGNETGNILLEDASVNGCDSMITVNIDFFDPASSELEVDLCPGDTIVIGGIQFFEGMESGSVVLPDASVNGCDSTINVTVNILPIPTFDFATTICEGDTLLFGGMQFFQGTESGSVTLEDGAANGCDSIINVELSFFPPAVADLTLQACPGDTVLYGGTQFFTGMESGTVILPDASVNGCDSIVNVTLEILPEPSFDFATTICPGDTLTFGGTQFFEGMTSGTVILPDAATNGCDSIVNVELSFFPEAASLLEATLCSGESIEVGGVIFDETNPDGEVILEGASVNGCDSTVTVDLSFYSSFMSTLDTTLCFGETLLVGDQAFTESGSMAVLLEGAASTGCDSTVMVTVTVNPELSAEIAGDDSICQGESAVLNVALSAGLLYDLSYSDGFNPPVMISGLADGDQITVSPAQSSTFTILEASAAGTDCPVSLSGAASVGVSDLAVQAIVATDYQGFAVSCFGGQNGMASVDPAGGIAPFSIQWSTGDTAMIIGGLGAGTYAVQVTDGAGCSSDGQVILTAPEPLNLSAEGMATGCFGESSGLLELQSISGGVGPYEFSLDGEFFQSGATLPFTVTDLPAGNYSLFIQDMNDCLIETEVLVPDAIELQMDLGGPFEITVGDSVLLSPETNFNIADWTWKPFDGLSQPDTSTTYASPTATTTYLLELVDENGCTISDIVQVFVNTEIPVYIPNVFSPNDDGQNDILYIFAGNGVEQVTEFQIYDRWGNQVYRNGPFQPNDPTYGWDGEFQGRPCNAAVYVYFAEILLTKGNTIMLEGDVILMR